MVRRRVGPSRTTRPVARNTGPHPEELAQQAFRRMAALGPVAHPSRCLLRKLLRMRPECEEAGHMTAANITISETPLVLYTLRRADDALILGHRLSEWCGHAPMLEEDMALANMALDLLGQARELYSYAGRVEGGDNDEDKFAYLRDVRQYCNLLLVEQPNGDFAHTMVRQFFYAAFADLYWRAMMNSKDATLAAIAAKSEKESAYHIRHCSEWIVRLGDGTDDSHARAQAAIEHLWAFTGEMFEVDAAERGLIDAGIAVDPASLKAQWLKTITAVVNEATLVLPTNNWMQQGGRD